MTNQWLPLHGVRVLDLTQLLPGPAATLQLVGLGAEVTKIEPPGGDPARHMGGTAEGAGLLFKMLNKGKTLLTLDLKQAPDRERLLAMVPEADVLIEGFRPGAMERLGLGWAVLHERNCRLVLCSVSGYGQQGPYRHRAGHDINYLGYAGVLAQTAGRDGRPVLSGLPVADLAGGTQAAMIALLAALLGARQTGLGRHIDVSMTHAVHAANLMAKAAVVRDGAEAAPGTGLLTGGAPCYGVYRTADDRFMAVGALEPKYWALLCEVLGRPDLASRHWSYGQQPGGSDADAVRAELELIFEGRTQAAWTGFFEVHDCCVTPVLRMDEAMAHPLFG